MLYEYYEKHSLINIINSLWYEEIFAMETVDNRTQDLVNSFSQKISPEYFI